MIETAAAAFFLVNLIRSFERIKVLMIDDVKPFACDLCMSFWGAVIMGWWRVLYADDYLELAGTVVETVASAGCCLAVIEVLAALPDRYLPDFVKRDSLKP